MHGSDEMKDTYRFSVRLFYRVYIVLVVCIIIIGTLLEYIINEYDFQDSQQYITNTHKNLLNLVVYKLSKFDQSEWMNEIRLISKQTNLQLFLFNKETLAADEATLNELSKGEILGLFNDKDVLSLYMQINHSPYIIELEVNEKVITNDFQWVPIVFYSLIALVIFLLIHPFAKQLLQLKSAAYKIGQGEFSTRLISAKGSTLSPIVDAFDTMTKEIEKLVTRQRDLTNAVSHELRTPLARLKFAFEDLEIQSTDKSWVNDINEMRNDVIELETLIDEMLGYAEATQIEDFVRSDIHVMSLINDLTHSMYPDNITLKKCFDDSINKQTVIQADEHFIFRALSNILRNSISFAEQLCIVDVTRIDDFIHIRISDDGPGIDSELKDRIFDPFYKVNNKNRHSGYGLGLAIAKSIIIKHEGTVQFVKGELKGACVLITLPI
jgi:two-component system OmpR family sensor kinase/two-component system sensor histidine kinase RstB